MVDFGIRGIDLTYALMDGYDFVILVDAAPRGETPGTLSVIEPIVDESEAAGTLLDAHGMDPAQVLKLARGMGGNVGRLLLVGCEPEPCADPEEILPGLSDSVRWAVEAAIPLILSLAHRLLRGEESTVADDIPNPWKEART